LFAIINLTAIHLDKALKEVVVTDRVSRRSPQNGLMRPSGAAMEEALPTMTHE
jgi:hypothetical protein